MSLALKKTDDTNFFTNIIYHVSFCIFLTLLFLHNAAISINIIFFIIGDIILKLINQFIMIASERSASFTKSCFVLVEFLAMNYIKYLDFALESQKKNVSTTGQGSIKSIFANATMKVQTPIKKGLLSVPNSPPSISPEIIKKSEAVRPKVHDNQRYLIQTSTEASPALSKFTSELSLRKAEKNRLPLEQRYHSTVPSSLGQNRSSNYKMKFYPSNRYSTLASEKSERTTSMKLINSTAANRATKNKKRQETNNNDVERQKSITKQKQVKPELNDKNLNLFDERPSLSQPSRKFHLNKSPEMSLHIARKYLKTAIATMKTKKHRNTI